MIRMVNNSFGDLAAFGVVMMTFILLFCELNYNYKRVVQDDREITYYEELTTAILNSLGDTTYGDDKLQFAVWYASGWIMTVIMMNLVITKLGATYENV